MARVNKRWLLLAALLLALVFVVLPWILLEVASARLEADPCVQGDLQRRSPPGEGYHAAREMLEVVRYFPGYKAAANDELDSAGFKCTMPLTFGCGARQFEAAWRAQNKIEAAWDSADDELRKRTDLSTEQRQQMLEERRRTRDKKPSEADWRKELTEEDRAFCLSWREYIEFLRSERGMDVREYCPVCAEN